MPDYDPEQFWSRFRTLAEKIAAALQTTVEYLVTGSDKTLSPLGQEPACAGKALEIALTAAKLSPEGQKTLLYVAKGLLTQLPKTAE
jgi:hypothetical protein